MQQANEERQPQETSKDLHEKTTQWGPKEKRKNENINFKI
jgi:hypothetical protein